MDVARMESIIARASEAVSNAPRVPEARLVLARALIAQNDLRRAESEIDRLLGHLKTWRDASQGRQSLLVVLDRPPHIPQGAVGEAQVAQMSALIPTIIQLLGRL